MVVHTCKGKQKQGYQDFKVTFVFMVSSRLAWTTGDLYVGGGGGGGNDTSFVMDSLWLLVV